ncbi:MAG: DUF262 domain-containing protein [Chitinophagaceae bacterium]|nr:DUF262 domain-containing protein [Chitinophagaceae bacterium]
MEISLKLKGGKEIRLKPLRFTDKKEDENIIRFVPLIGGEVYLKLELNGSRFTIVDLHKDAEEDKEELNSRIEEWLVEQNPNEQFGTEQTEIEENDETPYDPDKIRVDTKPFSLHQIYEMITRGDINLAPDFQRNLVWDNQRKSRLIESILMRIPLPMFYFAQDDEGRISVVDGLQRLSTIREFMNNELILKNLEYLDEKCGGKTYTNANPKKAIDAKYFRWFNMTQITVNVIDPSSPFKLKYDIFRRINTGGQPLNAQEIRNCLSSDALRQALREMAKLESFKEATGWSVKDVRMEAQELALRFIMFHKKYIADSELNNYSGNIESELNTLTEQLSKDKKFDYKYYVDLFDNSMKNAFYLFNRYSFRKCKVEHVQPGAYRQLINKALFVSWSVLLSQYKYESVIKKNDSESLALPLAEKVTGDNDLFMYLTYSTNSKANIQAAFTAAEEVIAENLK